MGGKEGVWEGGMVHGQEGRCMGGTEGAWEEGKVDERDGGCMVEMRLYGREGLWEVR